MKRPVFAALVLAIAGGVAAYTYFEIYLPRRAAGQGLLLYGNVDVRQVNLSFKVPGRISTLAVDEGDRVVAGQAIAALDKLYFENEVAIARAREAAQAANLAKLEHGSRPEEVAQAKANVNLARVAAENNRVTFEREATLLKGSITSKQNFDNAQAAARQSEAAIGPRTDQGEPGSGTLSFGSSIT